MGISDPYEEPLGPEIIVDSSLESVEQSAEKILSYVLGIGAVDDYAAQTEVCAT